MPAFEVSQSLSIIFGFLSKWSSQLLTTSPGDRFWPPFLGVALVIGSTVYAYRRYCKRLPVVGWLWFLFPKEQYLTRSSLLDLKIFFANRLVWLAIGSTIFIAEVFLFSKVAVVCARLIALSPSGSISTSAFIGSVLCLSLLRDFSTYVIHRSSHEWAFLWPFHALHHSAESLTPLTVYRKHPVYDLYARVIVVVMTAPPTGLIFGLLGGVHAPTVMAAGITNFLFHMAGSNLRHTHIWIGYGPILSRVLISPAMHQLHHSCALKHHGKNYGEIFSLWDWIFGTIYIPRYEEQLRYGLIDLASGERIQPHLTLKAAYLEPVSTASKIVFSAVRKYAAGIENPFSHQRVDTQVLPGNKSKPSGKIV
ncbi:MAG: sterol desaturase family protein [Myxococcales bacterium]|nr:sterol desaturase family protein [Myxococcales bacterium]